MPGTARLPSLLTPTAAMRRWFLSYNSQDSGLVQSLEEALRRKDPTARIFFAPKSLRAGALWLPELATKIADATAFVLLVGEKGIGPWQAMEYYEAFDRRVKQPDFPLVIVLLDGQAAPGLPFLRQMHWVITTNPASEKSLAQIMDAAAGDGAPPGELWRHTAPYRGLYAMTESDADFFFCRGRETVEVVGALAAGVTKLPVLLGNLGRQVVARAGGVLAALMRQAWPETAEAPGAWPQYSMRAAAGASSSSNQAPSPCGRWSNRSSGPGSSTSVDPRRAELQSSWASRLSTERSACATF